MLVHVSEADVPGLNFLLHSINAFLKRQQFRRHRLVNIQLRRQILQFDASIGIAKIDHEETFVVQRPVGSVNG